MTKYFSYTETAKSRTKKREEDLEENPDYDPNLSYKKGNKRRKRSHE